MIYIDLLNPFNFALIQPINEIKKQKPDSQFYYTSQMPLRQITNRLLSDCDLHFYSIVGNLNIPSLIWSYLMIIIHATNIVASDPNI